jgi:hypothetical protein
MATSTTEIIRNTNSGKLRNWPYASACIARFTLRDLLTSSVHVYVMVSSITWHLIFQPSRPFILNKYSAPAYIMMVMCIFTLFLLTAVFVDRMPGPKNPNKGKSSSQTAVEEYACTQSRLLNRIPCLEKLRLTNYDAAILACMMLNVALQGAIGCFETLGVAVAKAQYNLSMSDAGFVIGTCGSVGVVALLSMSYILRIASDVTIIAGGISTMGIGIFIFTYAGFHSEDVRSTVEYAVAIFFVYSTGFPVGHTAVVGLFSKCKSSCRLSIYLFNGLLVLIHFLPRSHYISLHKLCATLYLKIRSGRATTTGSTFGLVRICRIYNQGIVPHRIRIHRRLQWLWPSFSVTSGCTTSFTCTRLGVQKGIPCFLPVDSNLFGIRH